MKILSLIIIFLQINTKQFELLRFPYALPGCIPKKFKNEFHTRIFVDFNEGCKNLEKCFTTVDSPKEVCKGLFYDSMDEYCYSNTIGKDRDFCYQIVDNNILILNKAIDEFIRSQKQLLNYKKQKKALYKEKIMNKKVLENAQSYQKNYETMENKNFSKVNKNNSFDQVVNFADTVLNQPKNLVVDNFKTLNIKTSTVGKKKMFYKKKTKKTPIKYEKITKKISKVQQPFNITVKPFPFKIDPLVVADFKRQKKKTCTDHDLELLKLKWEEIYFEYYEIFYQNQYCKGVNKKITQNFMEETLKDKSHVCLTKIIPFKKKYKKGIQRELNYYWRIMCSDKIDEFMDAVKIKDKEDDEKIVNQVFKKEIKKMNPELLKAKLKNDPINHLINSAKDLIHTLFKNEPKTNKKIIISNQKKIKPTTWETFLTNLKKKPSKIKIKLKLTHHAKNPLNDLVKNNLTNHLQIPKIKIHHVKVQTNPLNDILNNNNITNHLQRPKIVYVPVPVQTNPYMNYMMPQMNNNNFNMNYPFMQYHQTPSYINMQNTHRNLINGHVVFF